MIFKLFILFLIIYYKSQRKYNDGDENTALIARSCEIQIQECEACDLVKIAIIKYIIN